MAFGQAFFEKVCGQAFFKKDLCLCQGFSIKPFLKRFAIKPFLRRFAVKLSSGKVVG